MQQDVGIALEVPEGRHSGYHCAAPPGLSLPPLRIPTTAVVGYVVPPLRGLKHFLFPYVPLHFFKGALKECAIERKNLNRKGSKVKRVRDSSAKNMPRNDSNLVFPQAVEGVAVPVGQVAIRSLLGN